MKKYPLKVTSGELSIRPYFGHIRWIRISVYLTIIFFGLLLLFHHLLSTELTIILVILGSIHLIYTVYDYLFRVSALLVFDRNTRSIYKTRGIVFKKRVMSFDEMTLITNSDCGSVGYSIGRKKQEFLKNHAISDTFSNNKIGRTRESAYVKEILNPILEFVKNESCQPDQ